MQSKKNSWFLITTCYFTTVMKFQFIYLTSINQTADTVQNFSDPGNESTPFDDYISEHRKFQNFFQILSLSDGEPTVYFSNRPDIRSVSLAGNNYSIAISRLKGVISFDFDIKNEYIYMADAIDETIKRAKINKPSSVETILTNVHTPDGIAVDWITGKLYWTDTGYKTIEVADIDGKHNTDLINVGLYEPRAIAVDPHTGYDLGILEIQFTWHK